MVDSTQYRIHSTRVEHFPGALGVNHKGGVLAGWYFRFNASGRGSWRCAPRLQTADASRRSGWGHEEVSAPTYVCTSKGSTNHFDMRGCLDTRRFQVHGLPGCTSSCCLVHNADGRGSGLRRRRTGECGTAGRPPPACSRTKILRRLEITPFWHVTAILATAPGWAMQHKTE